MEYPEDIVVVWAELNGLGQTKPTAFLFLVPKQNDEPLSHQQVNKCHVGFGNHL